MQLEHRDMFFYYVINGENMKNKKEENKELVYYCFKYSYSCNRCPRVKKCEQESKEWKKKRKRESK